MHTHASITSTLFLPTLTIPPSLISLPSPRPHQVVHQRAALEELLVQEAVEVGGDQHVWAVLPLGNPVPQGGCQQ